MRGRIKSWFGPRLRQGISVEYKDFVGTPYDALYVLIQPDHILDLELAPARGELLIAALQVAVKELSRYFGPITLDMLLHAKLKYLEICWDFRDLWIYYFRDLPLKFKRNESYKSGRESSDSKSSWFGNFQEHDVGLKVYIRNSDGRTCELLYEKIKTEGVGRIEFRYKNTESVKTLLSFYGNHNTLFNFLHGKGVYQKVMYRVEGVLRLFPGSSVVSRPYAYKLLKNDNPDNFPRLMKAMRISRDMVPLQEGLKKEYEVARRYFRKTHKCVVASHCADDVIITDLAECLAQGTELMVNENRAALARLYPQTHRKFPLEQAQFAGDAQAAIRRERAPCAPKSTSLKYDDIDREYAPSVRARRPDIGANCGAWRPTVGDVVVDTSCAQPPDSQDGIFTVWGTTRSNIAVVFPAKNDGARRRRKRPPVERSLPFLGLGSKTPISLNTPPHAGGLIASYHKSRRAISPVLRC